MADRKNLKIGGILLAAGGSSRLGQPKQLLEFQGKTLIRRAAEALAGSNCVPIIIVLGAETEHSTAELDGLDVAVTVNQNWQTGMSSSIIAGLSSLLETEPTLDALVITLCDQPHVSSADINELILAYRKTQHPIVAAQYGDTIGVPALFSKAMFRELMQLTGDKGARKLINENPHATINLTSAANDIDTPSDLNNLIDAE